jgi:hypothetical protein
MFQGVMCAANMSAVLCCLTLQVLTAGRVCSLLALLLLLLLQVAAAKGKLLSYALDTKGPEIRTAMLKGGKDIMLTKGELMPLTALWQTTPSYA